MILWSDDAPEMDVMVGQKRVVLVQKMFAVINVNSLCVSNVGMIGMAISLHAKVTWKRSSRDGHQETLISHFVLSAKPR